MAAGTTMKQRSYACIAARFAVVASYWAVSVEAYQSIFPVRDMKARLHAGCSIGLPTTVLHEETVASTLQSKSCFNAQNSFQVRGPVTLRRHGRAKQWTLFSSSSSVESPNNQKKKSILSRLRWLLSLPIRCFILNPLRQLAGFVVDDLDDDGTVAVAPASKVTIGGGPNETETYGFDATLEEAVAETPIGLTGRRDVGDKLERDAADGEVARTGSKPKLAVSPQNKKTRASVRPQGNRWAVAAEGVDLTGDWELLVSDEFRREYDHYLSELGQPLLVRSVAVGIIGRTTEETQQTDQGKSLLIRGRNVRGVWDRTLVASGTEVGVDTFTPLQIPIMTADSEKVEAESWWEEEGTVHVSWLRGVSKYGGGAFESRRYIDDNGVYVCESIFFPDDKEKKPSLITWKFRRQDSN